MTEEKKKELKKILDEFHITLRKLFGSELIDEVTLTTLYTQSEAVQTEVTFKKIDQGRFKV